MKSWMGSLTNEEGLRQIEQSVQKAEARTSCEIVPMIVRASTPTGHTSLVLFLAALVVMTAALPYLPHYGLSYWILEGAAIVLAWLIAVVLARFDRVHVWMTPARDLRLSVDRRATHEFYLGNVTSTAAKNGVLVFVSLLEHRAVVLTDSAVASRMPQETWNDAVTKLVAKTKAGDFAGGMCAAIEDLGAKLAQNFPIQPGDKNELSDLLVVKD